MSINLETPDRLTPFWFGPDGGARLLGWYHAPRLPARECAVLLCPPFGHEYLVAYRSYRKLAETLADAGFPVLFFDYDGTGDSDDSTLPRVQAWRESVRTAAQKLREVTGLASVALFGVRLGALIAASVAQDIGASALVLVAPCVSGRAYVRELLGFARMSPLALSTDPQRMVTDEEVVGYPFTHQTQTDLSGLDLLKTACVCPALVVARDDVRAQEPKLIAAWQAAGGDVTGSAGTGYAAMMTQDAHSAVPPMALWGEVRDWLSARFGLSREPLASTGVLAALMQHGESWREEVLYFNGLVGIVTTPVGRPPRRTGVVCTNFGTSHRVGNHRLYVLQARRLAEQGYCVLRFERAGCGYSQATPDGQENQVYAPGGTDDVRAAMDLLQLRCPCTRFALIGVCSGAYFSYQAAAVDTRVRGLVLINQLTFEWHEDDSLDVRMRSGNKSTQFYMRSMFERKTWLRILRREVAVRRIAIALTQRLWVKLRLKSQAMLTEAAGAAHEGGAVLQNFRKMLRHRVRVLFVFGADDASQDVVAAELGANAILLHRPRQVYVETVPQTDHTFTPLWAQAHLQEYLVKFMREHFH